MANKSIEEIQYQNYKFKLFLTVKQKILRKIKDEKIDEKIKLLRRVKMCRSHIILRQTKIMVMKYKEWLDHTRPDTCTQIVKKTN